MFGTYVYQKPDVSRRLYMVDVAGVLETESNSFFHAASLLYFGDSSLSTVIIVACALFSKKDLTEEEFARLLDVNVNIEDWPLLFEGLAYWADLSVIIHIPGWQHYEYGDEWSDREQLHFTFPMGLASNVVVPHSRLYACRTDLVLQVNSACGANVFCRRGNDGGTGTGFMCEHCDTRYHTECGPCPCIDFSTIMERVAEIRRNDPGLTGYLKELLSNPVFFEHIQKKLDASFEYPGRDTVYQNLSKCEMSLLQKLWEAHGKYKWKVKDEDQIKQNVFPEIYIGMLELLLELENDSAVRHVVFLTNI